MFKNIKYIDPKLYVAGGQVACNPNLAPNDWKNMSPLTNYSRNVFLTGIRSGSNINVMSETTSSIFNVNPAFYSQLKEGGQNSVTGNAVYTTINDSNSHSIDCCSFDSNYLTFNSSSLPSGTNARTLSCWIYCRSQSTTSGSLLIGYGDVSTNCFCGLFINRDKSVCFSGWGSSSELNTDANTILTNKWHHIVATKNGKDEKIYIDGVLMASGESTKNTINNSIGMIGGNARYFNQYFDGYISSCRIYDKELTGREILELSFEFSIDDISDNVIVSSVAPQFDSTYGFGCKGTVAHGNGSSMENAIDFAVEAVNNSVQFERTYTDTDRYYVAKLKANETYAFKRTLDSEWDDILFCYDEDGNYLWDDDEEYYTTYTATSDMIIYLRLGAFDDYMEDGYFGVTTLKITPSPEPVYQAEGDNACLVADNPAVLFGQKSFSYSIWMYKDESVINGTIFSLSANERTTSCLYVENNVLKFFDGTNINNVLTLTNSMFTKRGLKAPINIIWSYYFKREGDEIPDYVSIYVEGELKLTYNVSLQTACDQFIIGDAHMFTNGEGVFNGSLKWFRSYDRAISPQDVLSLSSEFDSTIGDGTTWVYPLSSIPENLDDDTLYIIRRHADNTFTNLNLRNTEIKKVGFIGCPKNINDSPDWLADRIASLPWVGENGTVKIKSLNSDAQIDNNTISLFMMNDVWIVRNSQGDTPIFKFNKSSDDVKFIFDKCVFTSVSDLSNSGTTVNNSSGRYFLSTGDIGDFIIRDSVVFNANTESSAFHVYKCNRAIISNVTIHSSCGEFVEDDDNKKHYNSFCFEFMKRDDDDTYIEDSIIDNVFIKNVTMNIYSSTKRNVPGLFVLPCDRIRMSDVNIEQESNSGTSNSDVSYNGMIKIHYPYDYKIGNININLPKMSKILYYPIVSFDMTDVSRKNNRLTGKEFYHEIDGVNIILGDGDDKNSDEQRNYWYSDDEYIELYSALSVNCSKDVSSNIPTSKIHLIKNSSVYSPNSTAVSMRAARGSFININGVIRGTASVIDVENLTNNFGKGAVDVWKDFEVNVENFTSNNGFVDNMVNYYSPSDDNGISSHIYIKNSNVELQKTNFSKNVYDDNSAFIYCNNMTVKNGFFIRGMKHSIIPVDIRRINGHGISLKLNGFADGLPFRFPPNPYGGIKFKVNEESLMTIHFSLVEENVKYSELVRGGLRIEVETSNCVYDSLVDGCWMEDDSAWSSNILKSFKYCLKVKPGEEEDVFVRVYYNIDSSIGGGLFMDPKIEWSII